MSARLADGAEDSFRAVEPCQLSASCLPAGSIREQTVGQRGEYRVLATRSIATGSRVRAARVHRRVGPQRTLADEERVAIAEPDVRTPGPRLAQGRYLILEASPNRRCRTNSSKQFLLIDPRCKPQLAFAISSMFVY